MPRLYLSPVFTPPRRVPAGCISAQQQQPTPFIIEWVPSVLPKSEVGELRLQFQFVHQRNGQLVDPPQMVI